MTEPTSPSSSLPSDQLKVHVGPEPAGASSSATDSVEGDAPAVVAVIVATNPGEEFDVTLASLAAQDYDNLSVLVVDAADGEPIADQVAAVLPDAYIHRVTGSPGFAAAANQAMTLISGAAFLLFCHDDVALDARCTTTLVEELYRSNAGIVSPKVVQWDDRRRLQQIGRTSDRFGVQVELVELDEFDQEQYDSVRDVFVAPSGVQLIRADLFKALGGFDPVIHSHGEDLDLCWRAHLAGARVLAVPGARARHRNEHPEFGSTDERRRLVSRHRLRTLLVVSSRGSLLRYAPIALLLLVVEALYCLVSGRRRQASAALGAMSWNASRLDEIRDRRKSVAKLRKVSDREIHALQIGGSARVSSFFQRQFGARQDRISSLVGSVRDSLVNEDSKVERDGIVIAAALGALLLFGSRNLVANGLVPVGQVPLIPSASSLLSEWAGGWRSSGLGGPGNAPTAFALFGLLRIVFFWAPSVFDWLIIAGPLAFGAIGMWRLLQPFNSMRASSLAMVAYTLNPIVVVSMSTGRWDSLVVFGATPSILASILRIQGIAPYGAQSGPAGSGVVLRDLPSRLLRLGLLLALVSSVVPAIIPLTLVMIGSIIVGSLLVARPAGLLRLGLAGVSGVVVPTVLHIPWSIDVAQQFSWAWLVGQPSPLDQFDSLADLLRFAPDGAPSVLTLGLLVAAGVSLVVARGRRFDVAVAAWTLALGSWMLLWAARRDLLSFDLAAPETMLMPAAAGLALAVGVGGRAVEIDLRTHRYGWRQFGVIGGIVGLGAFSLLGLSSSVDGRWDLPTHDYGSFTNQLALETEGPTRVLWLADSSVAPLDVHLTNAGTSFAVTNGAQPSLVNRLLPEGYGQTAAVGERLDLAARGETVRLGRLLGMYGIDYIVVLDRLAPPPFEGPIVHPDEVPATGLVLALESQLDLERKLGIPDLVVYRNTSSAGPVVSLDELGMVGQGFSDQLRTDLTTGERLDAESEPSGSWTASNPSSEGVWIAVDGKGWTSNDAAARVSQTPNGQLFIESTSGAPLSQIDVRYADSGYRLIGLAGQAALILVALAIAQTRREA